MNTYKTLEAEKVTQKETFELLSNDNTVFYGVGEINSGMIDIASKVKDTEGQKRTFKKITSTGIQYNESFLDLTRTAIYRIDNILFINFKDFGSNYYGVYKVLAI